MPSLSRADNLRLLHRASGVIAFLYGFTVNAVLVFLVLRSRLRAYKRLLLQMSFVDCTFLLLSGAVDPILVFVDGAEVAMQNGILRYVPQPLNRILTCLWAFGLYYSVFRNTRIADLTLIVMLIVPLLPAGVVFWLCVWGFAYQPEDERYFTEMLRDFFLESGETSINPAGIAKQRNVQLKALVIFAIAIMSLNYAIIAFCLRQINETLEVLAPHLRPSTRSLHKQLSVVLVVQAVLPLAVSVVPILIAFWCILTNRTAIFSFLFLTIAFNWVPSCNATVALLFVKQFRRKLTRACGIPVHVPRAIRERTRQYFLFRHSNYVQPSSGAPMRT